MRLDPDGRADEMHDWSQGDWLAALEAVVVQRDEFAADRLSLQEQVHEWSIRARAAEKELTFKKKALCNCREAHLAAEARVAELAREALALHVRVAEVNQLIVRWSDGDISGEQAMIGIRRVVDPPRTPRAALAGDDT